MLDETHYRVFKALSEHPEMTQRQLADALGISLGKANYCLREFVRRGFVKVNNFKNSNNKRAYMYVLTAYGIEEKVKVTYRFFQIKSAEYEVLRQEVEKLTLEGALNAPPSVGVSASNDGGQ
jgi:EPS-associated MarR family transcriptional regulator